MSARAIVLMERDGHDVVRWIVAAAIVVAVHVGLVATGLLFVSQQQQGNPSVPIVIQLAAMPVAPEQPLDVAVAPPMVEAPTPPPAPQVKAPPPPEPLLEPPPPIQPLVTLPKPPPPRPPEVEQKLKPDEKPPEQKPVERSKRPAPRTSAAPRSDRNTAQTPVPPSAGALGRLSATWHSMVASQLQRVKRYPAGAQSRREQGVVTVSFVLNRSGAVLSRRIARSSGSSELDQEVLAMVQRAAPFPPPPAESKGASFGFTVPVNFSLR